VLRSDVDDVQLRAGIFGKADGDSGGQHRVLGAVGRQQDLRREIAHLDLLIHAPVPDIPHRVDGPKTCRHRPGAQPLFLPAEEEEQTSKTRIKDLFHGVDRTRCATPVREQRGGKG
jgi:hypothetical protein